MQTRRCIGFICVCIDFTKCPTKRISRARKRTISRRKANKPFTSFDVFDEVSFRQKYNIKDGILLIYKHVINYVPEIHWITKYFKDNPISNHLSVIVNFNVIGHERRLR